MASHSRVGLPGTVGLCPDPSCTNEFYMPDARPGDRCPVRHDEDESPLLVIFARSLTDEGDPLVRVSEVVEWLRDAGTMQNEWWLTAAADAIQHRFAPGPEDGERR